MRRALPLLVMLVTLLVGAFTGYRVGHMTSEFTPGPDQVGITYCDGNQPRTFIDGRVFEDADTLLATEVIVHESVHRAQLATDCEGTMHFAATNPRARMFFEGAAYCAGLLAVSEPGTGDYARRRALATQQVMREAGEGFTAASADGVMTKVGCP